MTRPIPQQIQAIVSRYTPDGSMRLYVRFDVDQRSAERFLSPTAPNFDLAGWHYAGDDMANAVSKAIGREIADGPWQLGWAQDQSILPILHSDDVDADTRDWAYNRHLVGKGW